MQPDNSICRIAAKEITLFFASPIAYLFLASFVGVSLFVFFWGEAFFARNIADVRPLFEWMPILLLFLASTLTMRMWSEERRTGTLEYLLTQPVPLWHFVVGKFVGCLALLLLALAITLPLPLTVAWLGELDWGPVWAGYMAAFLLGAAYLSIGLFISARSDNQIVSLILSAVVCGFFYLLGTSMLINLAGNTGGEWLRLFGTGSRFDSITRGVIDLRDLYYYLSITLVFLTLNTLALERERWAKGAGSAHHRAWYVVCALIVVNALAANFWLGQVNTLRMDTTKGKIYSISEASRSTIQQLQEPLLLRGYFSDKTHPYLAPLVPQLRDLLREYEVAGGGRIRVEFVDPMRSPERIEDAQQRYGIQPVPFQVSDRYQASLINSYFDVLIEYGSEHQVLSFRDLIDVRNTATDVEVRLRNPEYDITRAIRRVVQEYQSGGDLFANLTGELTFNAYISADYRLPLALREFRQHVLSEMSSLQVDSGDRLVVNVLEPEAQDGSVAQYINDALGFQPMATSVHDPEQFYFYLTLQRGDQVAQIPLEDLSAASFRRNMEAAIKRFAGGFTKTVALVAPELPTEQTATVRGPIFAQLENALSAELDIVRDDLRSGQVNGKADILLLAAPEELDETQLFAVDQFLMQGGSVIIATSPYTAQMGRTSLLLRDYDSGLTDWLAHHGLHIESTLALDPQNTPLPVPITREVGGHEVQELLMFDYPYFIDVRSQTMNAEHPVSAYIPNALFVWASPIRVEETDRQVVELIRTTDRAWLSSSRAIMPRYDQFGATRYLPDGEQKSHLLGVVSQGRFDSWFAERSAPVLSSGANDDEPQATRVPNVIQRSPESARIMLFSSNDFLSDQALQLTTATGNRQSLSNLQLIANAVDYALEDETLLSIRARNHFNRTLPPMEQGDQVFWESINYGLALGALFLVAFIKRLRLRASARRYQQLFAQ